MSIVVNEIEYSHELFDDFRDTLDHQEQRESEVLLVQRLATHLAVNGKAYCMAHYYY